MHNAETKMSFGRHLKFSSLAALEVFILTISSAASDENFIKKMNTFPFDKTGMSSFF